MRGSCSRGYKLKGNKCVRLNKRIQTYGSNKTLVPNDLRDFLAIVGFLSALGLFWKFFLGKNFLFNGDAFFFILMGLGLLVTGKVFTLKEWINDGIQRNEFLFLFSLIVGLLSIISGTLLIFGINLPTNLSAVSGFVALFVGGVIALDYWRKNSR